ncbi:MAG: T9SS type A sorting domain-containing protein, partial [Candidatus Marinimicrobia bacterium]|nr:T9SS type A sorting domain-containing protein [Candidatus Neomarinimicrobiota bacterium]
TAVNSLFGGVLDVGGASNPVFIDFDGDGDQDLISGSQMGDIKYYENTGNVSGPAWNANHGIFSSIDHSIYSAAAAGDLDADGLMDLVVGDLSGNLYYHHNTGSGFSYESDMFSGINVGGWSSPRLYDLDFDQDLDLFIGREDGGISYYENTGTIAEAQWTEDPSLFSGLDVGSNAVFSLGDVNRDRNLDLITGDLFHEIRFFSYEDGSWVEHAEIVAGLTAGQNATPGLVDLNGDGDLDLAIGNYDGTFNYYENLTIVSIEESQNRPERFNLHPAYPNPFNPTTTIRYDLGESTDVSLIIYDVQGRVVKILVEEHRSIGQYKVLWGGFSETNKQVNTGVYFVELRAGGSRDVIKLVYLR